MLHLRMSNCLGTQLVQLIAALYHGLALSRPAPRGGPRRQARWHVAAPGYLRPGTRGGGGMHIGIFGHGTHDLALLLAVLQLDVMIRMRPAYSLPRTM